MQEYIRLIGPNKAVEIFGIRLVGVNAENGLKLLMTIAFVLVVLSIARGARWITQRAISGHGSERVEFWTRQGIHLATAAVLLLGITSIWFDDPTRLTTALGLITAGLAFALQKVVTAIAGYFIILRGQTFNVGDRIRMGGVRGDVIALGFTQTTIMEMGQPPSVQSDEPAMWIRSRQYTGRIVTVSNAQIFDEPVYNYSREFPYIWEEINLPISFSADRDQAERILLQIAEKHTVKVSELSDEVLKEMERRYFLTTAPTTPRVYYRLTDNWLELAVRFIAEVRGVRELKDQMSRDLLRALDAAGIGIASTTLEITGLPQLRLQRIAPDGKTTLGPSADGASSGI